MKKQTAFVVCHYRLSIDNKHGRTASLVTTATWQTSLQQQRIARHVIIHHRLC